ncbi:MAG: molybdopterin-binding protein [Oscillospiraceae bacterium]|nr:molybdopterin-binding protein [Oscillospiraceae bacterium]
MKRLPVEQAIGEILCHDMTAIRDGFKGVAFKRGHVIRAQDIPVLRSMGKAHIYIWEPGAGEVHEDEAGYAGAVALAGDGITISGPAEGRYTLTAKRDGLFTVDSSALKALNAVPDYTAATLPGNTSVRAGDRVAGVRIVPLVTARKHAETVAALSDARGPILSIRPYLPLKVGIIITGSEVYHGLIQDRFEPILRTKIAPFGGKILGVTKCPDDVTAIRTTADAFLAEGADLILFTGGMSVDPDDRTPTAIRATGAEVVVQGVPIQPGNMLMLAYLGETALIGVPGATMHNQTTSLDIVLPRIFVGDRLRAADFESVGEGGLCRGCKTCTYPTCYLGRTL